MTSTGPKVILAVLLQLLSLSAFSQNQLSQLAPQQLQPEATLADALENDQLRLRAWLSPADGIVARQQVELNIEVATRSWFAGGTRVSRFELDDAIVLRRNKFAVNSSRRDASGNWTVQLWTLTVYPQREGRYTIEPLAVQVSIATPDGEPIKGSIDTEALSFQAEIPAEIKAAGPDNWVVSTDFSVREQFDKALDGLEPGDAVRRNITIEAEGLAAMMLPALRVESEQGLAAYQKPARLEDRVNRGTYRALRYESIHYVLESEGRYQLPALSFWWWNLGTDSLEELTLPAHTLAASGDGSAPQAHGGTAADSSLFRAGLLAALLALAALVFAWRAGWFTRGKPSSLMVDKEKALRRRLLQADGAADAQALIPLLYQWLDAVSALKGERRIEPMRKLLDKARAEADLGVLDGLMSRAYGKGLAQEGDGVSLDSLLGAMESAAGNEADEESLSSELAVDLNS